MANEITNGNLESKIKSKTHGIEFQVLSFFLFGVLHLEQLATKLTSQLQRFAVRDAPSQKTAT